MVAGVVAFPRVASLAEVLAAAGPVVRSGSVVVRWAMGVAPSSVRAHVSAIVGEGSKRQNTVQHARTTHWTHTVATFTQECCYSQRSVQLGRGNATTTPWTSTIYYDDVSSGPRPKAHWYMLTHRCCDDTAPYWTPHRAAQSSSPTTTPLLCLSTTNHQVQSLSTKYYPKVLSIVTKHYNILSIALKY